MLQTTTNQLFSSAAADLILRTSDCVDFHVFSAILAEASPFFADLLSLPQPTSTTAQPSTLLPIRTPLSHVIDVTEMADVLEPLLGFVYPRPDPPIDKLENLRPVIAAAFKYDCTAAITSLRRLLVSPQFLEKEPTRVYAIACMHELQEEAKLASLHTLKLDLLAGPLPAELKYISAFDYHRLLQLHKERRERACELLVRPEEVRCANCTAVQFGKPCIPKWWDDFETRAKEELRKHPVSDTIFSLQFLSQSATAGCPRCGTSLLASHDALTKLKASIDSLPSTV
ncbi:hypothetical protein DACRYDRAFT_44920 [Dacryopinax primogenitus]|uniref:BTB domain-containing protein n=1 Tax=Dacryopinax primogenitus (strain DJM 731) TaxID=1858805 RepID=M5GFY7_DACPD|nr:uncharacterized protein DACRYDRAFT_44920 [Dacryopinax primogenitus]EJU06682.1 hypothetical protein DACRYDRAFT_44920 [Dacryopinax primogenitus]